MYLGDVIGFSAHNEVPAVLEIVVLGLRVKIDPGSKAAALVPSSLAELLDEASHTGDFEAGADDDDSIWSALQSHKAALGSKGGEQVVEFCGLGRLDHGGQVAHHLVELLRRLVMLVH
ncbi:hypothetical protein HYQ46_006413 [Verticillium longisporum]|nr:hypothetical protein HYQ46_006413 [Verticillium longisporum]